MDIKQTVALLSSGAEQVLPLEALEKKLATGRPLKIKFGADPTAPDLHLGHTVVLSKLRQFQDLGHEIIFLIGDFTARIGDPTGRLKTRPPLSLEEIQKNTKTYFDQVSRVLDPKKLKVCYNSEWLDKLTANEWIKLCAHVTVARITEREDFAKRLKEKQPISLHELLYPLLQAYDSVVLKADVELGGTDQTFNLLMGRFLQEQYGQEGQVILTMPILEGTDGVAKMSKSLGNTIALSDTPEDAFGKLMSISDVLMWKYVKLLLHKDAQEISQMQERVASGNTHPMELKKSMAFDIISRFWSVEAAQKGREAFEHLFQKRDFSHAQEVVFPDGGPIGIIDLLRQIGAVATNSEARRLITEGAVSLNEEKVADDKAQITLQDGMKLKVGKRRFYTIKVKS